MVPVIVNSVLGEHQIVMDIIAFVPHGDFPRSRLGEKQRGKILASWITRRMRTIAQFSIRDSDMSGIQQSTASADRQDQSKTGSMASGNTRQPAPLMENEDFAGLQPMERSSYRDQETEEPLHHSPLTPQATSISGEPAHYGNTGVTEHDQSYNLPPEVGDSGWKSPKDNTVVPRAESPVDANLHFGADVPTTYSPAMAGNSATTWGATAPPEPVRGNHDGEPHGTADETSSKPHVFKTSPSPPPATTASMSGPTAMPFRGRDSLPSKQKRVSSIPTGFTGFQDQPATASQSGGERKEYSHARDVGRSGEEQERYDMDDWPEEALLYQKHGSGYDDR